jgi:serralysin
MDAFSRGGRRIAVGDAGNDYLAATGSSNFFNGGPGNDQMVAAAGHSGDTFVFRPGSGQDSITGFEGGADNDAVDLRGFGLANLAALGPYISQVGADTLFVLNSGDILTLKNIHSGTLVDNDFIFV